MKTVILATGTTREPYLRDLEAAYLQRFPAKLRPEVKELAEGKTKAHTEATQLAALAALPSPSMAVALDERGVLLSSPEWASQMTKAAEQGTKTLVLLIGGADGLSPVVREKCHHCWALGRLTFPHQLVRGLLAEQLYRAHTIQTGHPYHRE